MITFHSKLMNIKISAVVITYNEEKNILDYIKQLDFVDEIIVVDSYSSDKTIELIQHLPSIKVFYRKFDNFSCQKNYAISLTSNDWILFLDADERIDATFRNEIKELLKELKHDAYFVKRNFFVKDKLIKYCGFQNDYAVRLFNKRKCKYAENKYVHEQIILKNEGSFGKMKTSIDHFSFMNIELFKQKQRLYSKLKAEELFLKNIKPNFFHFIIKPNFRFFHHYVIKLGFLDGKEGYIISKILKEHVYLRFKYLKEMNKKDKN